MSPAGNRTPVSWVTVRDTYHYTTEDFCLLRFVAVHFLNQLKCSLIKLKVLKSTHHLPGGESNPGLLSEVSDTYHYTTEDCCLLRFVAVHFLSQLKCSLIKQKVFKSTHNLPGGESNPGLLSDSQRYLPLYSPRIGVYWDLLQFISWAN